MSKMRVMTILVGLACFGCASVPVPAEELSQSESALRSARELGAGNIPQAALELKLSEDELRKAKELLKDEQNEEARLILLRSRADAELALAMTRQGQANSADENAQQQLRAVQKSVQ